MRPVPRTLLSAAALVILFAAPAAAQSRKLIAVGIGVSADRLDETESWDRTVDWIIFRIPRPERLGIAWDIGSDTDDVTTSTGPAVSGSLRMRHVLFGPAYTWRRGRTEVTASGLVGRSFNRFQLADGSPDGVTASATNSFAFRPDLTCWIDLGPLVGLKLSTSYMFSHTDLTTGVDDRAFTTRRSNRRLRTQVGIVFGIY